MRRTIRVAATLVIITAVVAVMAACGSGDASTSSDTGSTSAGAGADGTATLTLYNAQHEDLMAEMVGAFTDQTGIKVDVRNGSDLEMANQILQEGDRSPADVFVTENSPAMTLIANNGGFAEIDAKTVAQVPARYRPAKADWVGFAARATVLAYNTDMIQPSELPASIMDLADPKWKGKFGYSPTGADFQAIASAVVALKGEAEGKRWIEGLKANGVAYEGNSTVMKAVNDGEVPLGVIYHYYWYKDQAEAGDNSDHVKLHFFRNEDPGAFTSVSGAGVLASSKHSAEAQQLVEFLTSKAGQGVLAESNALEYPVASDVPADAALEPLDSLNAPVVDPSQLNSETVLTMMQDAGIL
jgi:iron(III) transport system substrate-binding protein